MCLLGYCIGCGCFLSTLKIALAFRFGKDRCKWGENNSFLTMDDGLAHLCQFHTLFRCGCAQPHLLLNMYFDDKHCVYFVFSGQRWCVASDRVFLSLSVGYLYISCLIIHVHIFVNALSCFHVCKILSYVEEIKNIYLSITFRLSNGLCRKNLAKIILFVNCILSIYSLE